MTQSTIRGGGVARRRLLAAAGGWVLSAPAVRAQGNNPGVALVIGNSKYSWEAPLPNVKRDVPDIARRFQAFGLKTELLQDLGLDALRRAIDKFAAAASGAGLAAFYFAGHGVFQRDKTYLVPVDADLSTPNGLEAMNSVAHVTKAMGRAGHRFMVFDNCRNNPSDGWRQREAIDMASGLGPQANGPPLPANTQILFSTAPGRIAFDGAAGENSPFAAALLRQLAGASADLQALPVRLRRDLLVATQGRQVMLDYGSYDGSFVINGKSDASARRNPGDPSRVIELTNTYALVQQQGLPLLPGLIACRPTGNSPAGQKVGGYSFTLSGGPPSVLAVLSADDQGADLAMSTRVKGRGGWRLMRGDFAGDSLEFTTVGQGPRFAFKWSNAGSGSVSLHPPQNQTGNAGKILSGTFSRIDG